MCHQSQRGFWGIIIVIPQHQNVYLVYVPSTIKIVSYHDVAYDETISSALAYTSHKYSEALATRPAVAYILYATSCHEQTGGIITFTKFEEGGLVEK